MMAAAGSVVALALATALLFAFFAQPLAGAVFLPITLAVGLAGWFSPAWGLSVYLVSSLVTLQIPILAETPFFSGPEPGFLALVAVTALRRLRQGAVGGAAPWLAAGLVLHGGATVLAAAAVWWSLSDLPGDWFWALSRDAVSKIFFWRWRNPFNFLRMTLLVLEGIAACWIAFHAVRTDSRRTIRQAAWSFVLCAFLLAGYSAMELLFRGKTISLYPGFGPVFNDRNAYAAFWVLAVPICLGLAGTLGGLRRLLVYGIAAAGVLCCLLSLSLTGLVGMAAVLVLWGLAAFLRRTVNPAGGVSLRRWALVAAVVLGSVGLTVLVGLQPAGLNLQERLHSRFSLWQPAIWISLERPLLGLGPGRYLQERPLWRERLQLEKVDSYEHEHVHNYYLQLAAETGFPGLAGFLLAAGAVLVPAWRRLRAASSGDEQAEPGRASKQSLIAGLVVGLVGLLVVSVAQHPLLLFSFQTWFWIVAGLVAGTGPVNPVRRLQPVGLAVTGLAAVGFLHFLCVPSAAPRELVYGLHLPGKGLSAPANSRITEAIAFVRSSHHVPEGSLRVHSLHREVSQTIELELNGDLRRLELQPGQSVEVGWQGTGERWDLGIRVSPAAPLVFADSLGGGVVIEGLPESLEAEPEPR